MSERLKIKEGLYIDLEDFYEKVCKSRNVVTYDSDIEESLEE